MTELRKRQLEKEIERKCVQYANDHHWQAVKTDLAARGWPDRIFFGPCSQVLIIEFKRPGEKARKKQIAVHERLAELGHPVSIVTTFSEFVRLLNDCESLAIPTLSDRSAGD